MSDIFQVPAVITKISTMSNSLRLHVDTQETLSADSMSRLLNLYNQLGYFVMAVEQVQAEDLIDLPKIKKIDKKSQSQKIRDVIWLMWQKDDNGYEEFNDYYNWYTDLIIEKLKEKLD